jgi:hypothetical protein
MDKLLVDGFVNWFNSDARLVTVNQVEIEAAKDYSGSPVDKALDEFLLDLKRLSTYLHTDQGYDERSQAADDLSTLLQPSPPGQNPWACERIQRVINRLTKNVTDLIENKYLPVQSIPDKRRTTMSDNKHSKMVEDVEVVTKFVKPLRNLAMFIMNSTYGIVNFCYNYLWKDGARYQDYRTTGDAYNEFISPFFKYNTMGDKKVFFCVSMVHMLRCFMDVVPTTDDLGKYLLMELPMWTRDCDELLVERRSAVPFSTDRRAASFASPRVKTDFVPALLLWFKNNYENDDNTPADAFGELWDEYTKFRDSPMGTNTLELIGPGAFAYVYVAFFLLPRLDDYKLISVLDADYNEFLRALRCVELIVTHVREVGYTRERMMPGELSLLTDDPTLVRAMHPRQQYLGIRYAMTREQNGVEDDEKEEEGSEDSEAATSTFQQPPHHLPAKPMIRDWTWHCPSPPPALTLTVQLLTHALMGHLHHYRSDVIGTHHTLGSVLDCLQMFGVCTQWKREFMWYYVSLGFVQQVSDIRLDAIDLKDLTMHLRGSYDRVEYLMPWKTFVECQDPTIIVDDAGDIVGVNTIRGALAAISTVAPLTSIESVLATMQEVYVPLSIDDLPQLCGYLVRATDSVLAAGDDGRITFAEQKSDILQRGAVHLLVPEAVDCHVDNILSELMLRNLTSHREERPQDSLGIVKDVLTMICGQDLTTSSKHDSFVYSISKTFRGQFNKLPILKTNGYKQHKQRNVIPGLLQDIELTGYSVSDSFDEGEDDSASLEWAACFFFTMGTPILMTTLEHEIPNSNHVAVITDAIAPWIGMGEDAFVQGMYEFAHGTAVADQAHEDATEAMRSAAMIKSKLGSLPDGMVGLLYCWYYYYKIGLVSSFVMAVRAVVLKLGGVNALNSLNWWSVKMRNEIQYMTMMATCSRIVIHDEKLSCPFSVPHPGRDQFDDYVRCPTVNAVDVPVRECVFHGKMKRQRAADENSAGFPQFRRRKDLYKMYNFRHWQTPAIEGEVDFAVDKCGEKIVHLTNAKRKLKKHIKLAPAHDNFYASQLRDLAQDIDSATERLRTAEGVERVSYTKKRGVIRAINCVGDVLYNSRSYFNRPPRRILRLATRSEY